MEFASRRFLEYLERERGCSENTILAYQADLNQFRQVILTGLNRSITPETLTGDHLRSYVKWLNTQGYQSSTISRKIASVRSFLAYLNSHEKLRVLRLLEQIPSPSNPRRKPRVLSKKELNLLLKAPLKIDTPRAKRDHAILSLLYTTGLRAAEVIDLDMDNVNVEQGVLSAFGNRSRAIPLGPASGPIRRYIKNGRPHLVRNPQVQAFFLNQRGQRLSRQGLWLVVKRWSAKAGLSDDISPHTLRHTLVRDLLMQGKSRQDVQKLLGLSSPSAIWSRRKLLD
jgi:integrase/recombinase XerD